MLGKSLIFLPHKLYTLWSQFIKIDTKIRHALIVVYTYVFIAPIDFVVSFTGKNGARPSIVAIFRG